jgi:hypothetical protein
MDAQELQVRDGKVEHKEEIHLFVGARNGSSDAVVAVRWCICQSILDVLKAKSAQNPHILLVVTHRGVEVDRKLVPLEQEMEYFYFQRPGSHRIQSTIVCWKDVQALRAFIRRRESSDILDYDGELRKEIDCTRDPLFQIGRGETGVNVAPEFFAKEPPKWLGNWVNLWYETKPRDQCQFRRRCMLAFSLQPFVVLLWAAFIICFRLLAALFLRFGVGMRGISFKPAYCPLSMDTNDVWRDENGSVFLTDECEEPRPWFLQFFMPVVVVSWTGFLYSLKWWLVPDLDIWWALATAIGILGSGALIGYLIPNALKLFEKALDFSGSADRRRRRELRDRWRRERIEMASFNRYDEVYSSLVCQRVPLQASLDALPKNRRTFYLRFMDLKTKVCRPFPK